MVEGKNKEYEKVRRAVAAVCSPWNLKELNPGFEHKYFNQADQILSTKCGGKTLRELIREDNK